MIKSMTGYARAETSVENPAVSVELRTYNSRYLDTVLRLPPAYAALEENVKNRIAAAVSRGRIEVRLQVRNTVEAGQIYEVNLERARAVFDALQRLKNALTIETPISIEQITAAGDILQPVEVFADLDREWPVIDACLQRALDQLDAMRRREGDHIAEDIIRRIAFVSDNLQQIKTASADLPATYRDRLRERIAALTNGIVEIDPDRIAQEAAFLADRSDITEEIVRAQSHLKQFLEISAAAEPSGRKLNFLLQELNREFNTIGAKTEKSTVAHRVVDVKSELEKIREQIQNVE
jgi:uncharacterized protein (TIGR00255 family)